MTQHFTQSKGARDLPFSRIAKMSEYECRELLLQIRFAVNGGEPACPRCNGENINMRADYRFFCRKCRKAFSITSGTIWHGTKMSAKTLLLMVAAFVRERKAFPSIAMARELGCTPTTAWLALHKLRQAMASDADGVILQGVCEADGCYLGGWVRQHVYRPMRKLVDQRKSSTKKAVCAVRERKGRVLVQINRNEKSFEPYIRERVQAGTELHTDSSTVWEKLGDTMIVKTINHATHYWTPNASTNSAESFFRRLRAAEDIHIHISGPYLDLYAWEAAFRETYCRASDGEKFARLLSLCLSHPYSRRFGGYQQRGKGEKGI